MVKLARSGPVTMRPLTASERQSAFARAKGYSLAPYVEAVREMEGGVAYALTLNGLAATALKRRMNLAAQSLDLKLVWAPSTRDARELAVELSE